MNNKRILVIITEGDTDTEFYKGAIATIKKQNDNIIFNFDRIDYLQGSGIGNYKNKIIAKFKYKFCGNEYQEYDKIVCLTYDFDVFEFNQRPPLDRKKLKQSLIDAGATKIIEIVAHNTIEDFFVKDLNGIKKYLNLPKRYKPPQETGLELIKRMFRERDRIYNKGSRVEGLIASLNLILILSSICNQIKPLCNELGCSCDGSKCKGYHN